jgi:hypothetical protein
MRMDMFMPVGLRPIRLLAAAAAALVACSASTAQQLEPAATPRKTMVNFSLIADGPATPGGVFTLGLTYDITKAWHTYWEGLNDTGMPASWTLELPEGWKAGTPAWPAPVRYGMDNGVVDHVYFDQATILIPISVPAEAPFATARIKVASKWLVCEEACIPERGSAELAVAVIDRPARVPEPPAIARALARTIESGWGSIAALQPVAALEGSDLIVRVPGATLLAFFPASDSSPAVDLVADGEAKGDVLRVPMHQRAGEVLTVRGVVEVTRRDGKGATQTSWHTIDVTPKPAPGLEKTTDSSGKGESESE